MQCVFLLANKILLLKFVCRKKLKIQRFFSRFVAKHKKNSTDIFTPELSSTKVQIYLLALGEDLALH